MFNPRDLIEVAKVSHYFDLDKRTSGDAGDSLDDEEYRALAHQRITLFYEIGFEEVDDDEMGALADEHLPPLN